MRRLATVAFLFVCASSAMAFDGPEHVNLSNAALRVAIDTTPKSTTMAAAVEDRLADAVTFGHVTEAVDWFQFPDNLLEPDPLATVIAHRHRQWLRRGLAVHNNVAHFQDAALERWRCFHQHALAMAKSRPREALLQEAVALHYLQDFFSAGHVVTPRDGMHNAVAGNLHDAFNQYGVEFDLGDSLPEDVRQLVAALSAQKEFGFETADEDVFVKAAGSQHRFHGDGSLSRERCQRMFVALISALSVRQVLAASDDKAAPGLEVCFSARSRRPDDVLPHMFGPDGGIRLAESPPQEVGPCVDGAWLGRYMTRDDRRLTETTYSPTGITLRTEIGFSRRDHKVRFNTDILFFVFVEDPPRGTKRRWHLLNAAMGPTLSHSGNYNSVGWLYDYLFATPHRPLTWAIRLAPRRYGYGKTHPWRIDYGLKASLGVEVVSVIASIERAHSIDRDGKFVPEYFGMVGAEISLSSQWTRKGLFFWRGKK